MTRNRSLLIATAIGILFIAFLENGGIKGFLWAHPWFHAFLASLPPLAVSVVGLIMDARDSQKTGELLLRVTTLQGENNQLHEQLDSERNEHLQQIARNTEPVITKAERNAAILK